MAVTAIRIVVAPRLRRACGGPDAASYLQAMVSNDVEALGDRRRVRGAVLPPAEGARHRAAVVLRRGVEDFLLDHRGRSGRPCPDGRFGDSARGEVRDRARGALPPSSSSAKPRGFRPRTTACPLSSCSTSRSSRRWATTSSRSCASAPGRHGSGGRSTIACSRPKQVSMREPSTSKRGAIRGRADRASALPRSRQSNAARARDRRHEGARTRRRAGATTARSSGGSRASPTMVALAWSGRGYVLGVEGPRGRDPRATRGYADLRQA